MDAVEKPSVETPSSQTTSTPAKKKGDLLRFPAAQHAPLIAHQLHGVRSAGNLYCLRLFSLMSHSKRCGPCLRRACAVGSCDRAFCSLQ